MHTYVGHVCTFPGCTNVIVIDGNLKNRRDICASKSAGHLEFIGLPGTIETGCQLTPCWQSRYCYNHAPRISGLSVKDSDEFCPEDVVQYITEKRQTRSGMYYHVSDIYSGSQIFTECS